MTLQNGITNPTILYTGTFNRRTDSWTLQTYWFNLWDNQINGNTDGFYSNVTKTIYDPNPRGFSMPKTDSYTGFRRYDVAASGSLGGAPNIIGSWMNGYSFVASGLTGIYFPATGYIRFENGNSGYHSDTNISFYWTACTPNNTMGLASGYALYFTYGTQSRVWCDVVTKEMMQYNKGSGFAVRPFKNP